jgi:hypothetical protein
VFEFKLSVENQTNELKIYTSQPIYTIPPEIWSQLTMHSAGRDVHVSLRGHTEVKTVITPPPVSADTGGVSCHTSSPDGALSFFTHGQPGIRAVTARKVDGTVGAPSEMHVWETALALLGRDHQAVPTLSGAHESQNDAAAITVFIDPAVPESQYQLAWTDMHATDSNTGWGILPRIGDPQQPASPTWWHDGSTIAYTVSIISAAGVVSGSRMSDTAMNISTVPYNNRQGGQTTHYRGERSEPDRTLRGDLTGRHAARVQRGPLGGPVRRADGRGVSWCGQPAASQFAWRPMTRRHAWGGLTRFENGVEVIAATYPAIYVTSQVAQEDNHTSAWDVFQIKPPK